MEPKPQPEPQTQQQTRQHQPLGVNPQFSLCSLNVNTDFQVENCFLERVDKPKPASTRGITTNPSSSLFFGLAMVFSTASSIALASANGDTG